jgi:uncharacterized integral membrane protein
VRLRGILLTIVVLLALLLAVLNWGTLITPLPLDLLLLRFDWPLGLTLLGVAVVVAVLFFLSALVDRAGQLRQVTQLERQREGLQRSLDACRSELAERGRAATEDRLEALDHRIQEGIEALSNGLRDELAAADERQRERLDALAERVGRVRDELAADIAQSEDSLARRLDGEGPSEG